MKRFNAAMQVVFSIIGVIGFFGVCTVDDSADNWFNIVMVCMGLFLVGFIGSAFFDNPARILKYVVGGIVIAFAAIYNFFHEIVEVFRMFYRFKNRCGSYKRAFQIIKQNYYKMHSTYHEENYEEV